MAKSKYITNQTLSGNLNEHPAVLAWSKIMPNYQDPVSIRILKKRRKARSERSGVYLLEGVGPSGSAVVAKRYNKHKGMIESTIYSEILPRLPVSDLGYYGLFEEENTKYCWLFIKDAGVRTFLPNNPNHRAAAGHWLGKVHSSAMHIDKAVGLPDRRPNYYQNLLKSAHESIHPNISNPSLDAEGKSTLIKILANLDFLETHWPEIEGVCKCLPNTVVHGDFSAKNIRIQKNHGDDSLLVFDWEVAGWGTPVVDLAQSPDSSMRFFTKYDISTNWYMVKDQIPDLDIYTLERIAYVGTLFRLLAVINWTDSSLSHTRELPSIRNLAIYEAKLSHEIRPGKCRV